MRRYPPSTIYRYLDLPYTQIIRTHNTHRHNTTPPLQTLVQATYPLPSYITHTTTIQTQTHDQHSPCSHKIGKAQTQTHSSHSLTHSSHTQPRAKHIHISHTPPPPLIPNTSAVLDTILEPHVPPTCKVFTTATPPPSPKPRTLTLSQHTHMQHEQQYTHHSHSNHHIHIG